MEDEKLIELVRKYEFIYNLKHPKYMDNSRKDVAWKEIAEQLKQSTAACKLRWQSLRDAYRRALNKKKRKSGLAAKSIRKWKYETEMAFVVPFFTERKRHNSVEMASDDEDAENDEGIENNSNHGSDHKAPEKSNTDIANEKTYINADDCNSRGILEEEVVNISKIDNITHEIETKKAKEVIRKMAELEQSISPMLMAKLLDDQNKNEDELDRFFLNISDTVKKFSPYEQALAKNKIFTLVSEMELQQLALNSSSRYAYCRSPQSAPFKNLQNTRPTSPVEDSTDQPHFYEVKLL